VSAARVDSAYAMMRRSRGGVSAKGASILHATLLLIREIICNERISNEYEFFATVIRELEHTASSGVSFRKTKKEVFF
jgi:hypothetical protein